MHARIIGRLADAIRRVLIATLVSGAVALVANAAEAFSLVDPDTWPFIPIPEVATDPNGGTTYGLLPVFLFHDDHGQINSIFAPDVTNNATLGPGGTFRYLSYPSADVHWFVFAGAQEKRARKVELQYSTGRTRQEWWSLDAHLLWEHDPTERFFGVGNTSRSADETNYTVKQLYFESVLRLNLTSDLQLGWVLRPRYVRIGRGAFDSVPFTGSLFPKVKGLDGGSELLNGLVASYDTRDSVDLPTSGTLFMLFGAIADRRLASSASFTNFGGELRHYFPLGDRFTLAAHAYLQFTPAGNETPFWSMTRLGGQSSDYLAERSTLRGYGTARFTDNNIEGLNLELRCRVFDLTLFKTRGTFQLAPFFDAGRVSHTMRDNPVNRFHPAGGVGFRGLALPFVVGYVDVGYASEGFAVFSGIDYPF